MSESSFVETNARSKDWIFNALWAAAGNSAAPKCNINLPVTFIFRNGQPLKALHTDKESGFVSRLEIDPNERIGQVSPGFRGEKNRFLRHFRNELLKFSTENNYDVEQNVYNPKVCTTFYSDGEIEHIDLSTLDILLKNETWRMQVLLAQGYVPRLSEQKGYYYERMKVRSLITSQGAVAADKFTKALSKFLENAYSYILPDDTRLLKVLEMVCLFALDNKDHVILIFAEETIVDFNNGATALSPSGHPLDMSAAAASVSKELLELLRQALKKGLPIRDSFAHFDTQRCGYVDTDMLVDGLARLGIGVVYPVAEKLLELIGGVGTAFVTLTDYDRYIRLNPDIEVFEKSFHSITSQGSEKFRLTGTTEISSSAVNSPSRSALSTAAYSPHSRNRSPNRRLNSSQRAVGLQYDPNDTLQYRELASTVRILSTPLIFEPIGDLLFHPILIPSDCFPDFSRLLRSLL